MNKRGQENFAIPTNGMLKQWHWYLTLGIALIILGSLAIIFSLTSTIASVIYLGIALVAIGFFEAIKASSIKPWGNFLLHLILAVIYAACGIFIALYPLANALSLTLFLAAFFVASGVIKILFALTKHIPHQGWVLLSAGINILLGLLIWQQWPASGLWVIGTFVGIDAIFNGWSWIMLAIAARRLQKALNR